MVRWGKLEERKFTVIKGKQTVPTLIANKGATYYVTASAVKVKGGAQ